MGTRVAGRRRLPVRLPQPRASSEDDATDPRRPRRWRRLKIAAGATTALLGAASAAIGIQTWVGAKLEPPLTVTTEHVSNGPCAPGQVVPQPPESLGAIPPVENPDDPDARERWVVEHGGVDASSTSVSVTVQGTSDRAVILTGLTVDVVARRTALAGTNIAEACGDALWARYFEADLDATPPTVGPSVDQRVEVALEGTAPADPIDFPYTVTAGDPELFSIIAYTESCDCEWTATLHWRNGESEGRTSITDDGSPFRVTAVTSAPRYGNYAGGPLQPQG